MAWQDDIARALEATNDGAAPRRPTLRTDLEVEDNGAIVRVRKPGASATFELRDIEWAVAQLLDGNRGARAIMEGAARLGLVLNERMLRAFVKELGGYGFLAENGSATFATPLDTSEQTDIDWFVQRASTLQTRGQTGDARQYLVAALEADPSSEVVRSMLRDLDRRVTATAMVVATPVALSAEADDAPVEMTVIGDEPLDTMADDEAALLEAARESEALARNRMRRRAIIVVSALAVFVGVAALVPWSYDVRAEVELLPNEARVIASPLPGQVRELLVTQGSHVNAGDVVAKLDTKELDNELAALEAEQRKQEAELDRLRNGSRGFEKQRAAQEVAMRRAQVTFLQREFERKRKGRDVLSAGEIERAEKELRVARAELGQSQAELALVRAGSRDELVRMQEAQVTRVVAQVELARLRLERLTLKAPISGTIITAHPEKLLGVTVRPGETLLDVMDTSTLRAELRIDPDEAYRVKRDAPLTVWLYGFATQRFTSQVSYIASAAAEEKSGRTHVSAEAWLRNDEGKFLPGMKGVAKVHTAESSLLQALLRPTIRAWHRLRLTFF